MSILLTAFKGVHNSSYQLNKKLNTISCFSQIHMAALTKTLTILTFLRTVQ